MRGVDNTLRQNCNVSPVILVLKSTQILQRIHFWVHLLKRGNICEVKFVFSNKNVKESHFHYFSLVEKVREMIQGIMQ